MLDSIHSIQEDLELMVADEAVARQRSENVKAEERHEWSDTKAGHTYVNSVMGMRDTESTQSFMSMIAEFMDVTTKKQSAGRHNPAAHLLAKTGLDAKTITFLTLKGVLNYACLVKWSSNTSVKRSTLAIKVAQVIHDEWRVQVFQDTDYRKKLMRKLLRDFDRKAYPKEWRKRTLQHYFDAEAVDWSGWTPEHKGKVGLILLIMFQKATGFIEFSPCGTFVNPTAAFDAHVSRLLVNQASMFTLYRPMVVPPKPWCAETNLFKGGYLTNKVRSYPIIKGSGKRDAPRMLEMNWSTIIPTINAMQETPWHINSKMLDALQWSYYEYTLHQAKGLNWRGIGKLPCCEEEAFPPLPHDYDTNELVKKNHNRILFDIRSRRREALGRRKSAEMTLGVAKQFKHYDKLYFPHSLDSRGRAYPVPAVLNPQGPDYTKALLEFSRGETVDTTEALDWIAIVGANAAGNDKISLAERVQWVTNNEDMILSIAADYQMDMRWLDMSEPFQFLRFCYEWQTYKNEGLGFVSHMVCSVDATCSGLQHYAALMRDEVGGKSVNLIPGFSRQDIYGDVAAHVINQLTLDDTPMARDWLKFGIDRTTCKRQVMVVPYAGTYVSCMKYTREALSNKFAAGYMPLWDLNDMDDCNVRIGYLAKLIWQAIDNIVVRGKVAMKWLSICAAEYSRAMNQRVDLTPYEKRLTWTTPDGFEVVHYREEEKQRRIDTVYEGRHTLAFYVGTGKLNPRDMATAVAPNFVHSLDATHLRLTIVRALQLGITDFGMVHDSFGVHAKFMPQFLTECVKPAFVQMYEEHDVLKTFAARIAVVADDPELPEKGSLNLRGVLKSEFFFS